MLRNGVGHGRTLQDGLEDWRRENGFDSAAAIGGLKDATRIENVDALFRAQCVAALTEYLPVGSAR